LDTINVKIEGIEVNIPHPANFALHKLIVFQRRTKEEKALKDRNAAVVILNALINKGDVVIIKHVFNSMISKWQKKVVKGLEEAKEKDILNILAKGKL
jgi:hypothetical protein